jgi:hypothetical protein
LRKSAELEVKVLEPEAPVIMKPVGALIWTELSCWVDASFVIAKAKEIIAPATGLVGDTTTAKHLPDEVQVLADVDPAAGAASIAAPSMPTASTPENARARAKPVVRMAAPSSASTDREGHERIGSPPLPDAPVQWDVWTVLVCLRAW